MHTTHLEMLITSNQTIPVMPKLKYVSLEVCALLLNADLRSSNLGG
jgi:hypothetical protein